MVKEALALVKEENLKRAVQRTGITVEKDLIKIDYNVPLRNHSGQLNIHYDTKTGATVLKAHLLGEARERWGFYRILLDILNKSALFPLSEPIRLGEQEISFGWKIRDKVQLKAALREYAAMAESTIYGSASKQVKNLVERGLARADKEQIQALGSIAKEYFFNTKVTFQKVSMNIFKSLLEQEHGFEVMLEAVLQGLENSDSEIRSRSLKLLRRALNKSVKSWYEPIVEVAMKAAGEKKSKVLGVLLHIIWDLLQKETGYEPAEKIAMNGLEDKDVKNRSLALDIFETLVDWGKYYESAEAAANKGMEDVWDVQYASLKVFESLVAKGQAYASAKRAAFQGIDHFDKWIRGKSNGLLDTLKNI